MIGMWNIEENCQDWDPLKNDMLYSFAAAICCGIHIEWLVSTEDRFPPQKRCQNE